MYRSRVNVTCSFVEAGVRKNNIGQASVLNIILRVQHKMRLKHCPVNVRSEADQTFTATG